MNKQVNDLKILDNVGFSRKQMECHDRIRRVRDLLQGNTCDK